MTTRVRLIADITGTRNGAPWPPPGSIVDLPAAEAVDLLNAGHATPVEGAPAQSAAMGAARNAAAAKPRKRRPTGDR